LFKKGFGWESGLFGELLIRGGDSVKQKKAPTNYELSGRVISPLAVKLHTKITRPRGGDGEE